HAFCHQHCFCEGSRSVVHRGICHFHPGQLAHECLKLKDRLQCSLGNLRLIRCVGGKKLGTRKNMIDDGWNVMRVSAAAEKTDPLRARIARAHLFESVEQLYLGKCGGSVEWS